MIWNTRAKRDKQYIQSLEAALKPFADYADPFQTMHENMQITNGSRLARRQLTMGDCYTAKAILSFGKVGR